MKPGLASSLLIMVVMIDNNEKSPRRSEGMVSEVKLLLHRVALIPLGSVHVPNLLDLFDQLLLFTMLREHEEKVKLGAPLKLDPGHAVVINHRLDDVVFLDLPHCGNRGLQLLRSGRSRHGVVGFGHGNLRVWWGVTPTRLTLTRLLAVTLVATLLH